MLARMPLVVAGLISSFMPAVSSPAARNRAPAAPIQPVSADQAAMIVLKRPEMGALAHRIETASHRQTQLAIMHDGERPQSIRGVRYWVIGVYERHDTTMPRRGTLLVRVRDGLLFGQEISTGRIITFRDWAQREGLRYHEKPVVKATSTQHKHVAKRHHTAPAPVATRTPSPRRTPALRGPISD
ncbi:MAG: hypothetical protein PHU85_09995 [Phycisphaerae bacterium]|nr:hypothetical protein [Phycisphaerae bacterium]